LPGPRCSATSRRRASASRREQGKLSGHGDSSFGLARGEAVDAQIPEPNDDDDDDDDDDVMQATPSDDLDGGCRSIDRLNDSHSSWSGC
jgi:hypothetical protein